MRKQALLGLILTVTAANAQLRGIWKSTKDQMRDAVRKESGATSAGRTSPPVRGPVTGSTSVGAEKQEELWPNLAIDPEIVKRQQEELRKDCLANQRSNPSLGCDCIVNRYPGFRLRRLSQEIRHADREQQIACKNDPETCSRQRLGFEQLTTVEAQRIYPLPAPNAAKTRGQIANLDQFFGSVYLDLSASCTDHGVIAKQAENDCLDTVGTGLIKLPPGKSTAAYCGCVRDKVAGGIDAGRALSECHSK
ncbi:MAG: hypothetical protein ACKV22_32060 [Bryobacteraceae bacterium]